MSDSDLAGLSYEKALAELDSLITRLETGDVELEEAIACYERGSRLARHCAELLDRTEQRVTQLVVGGPGGLHEKPLAPAAADGAPSDGPPSVDAAPGSMAPPGRSVRPETVPRARTVAPRPPDAREIDPDDIPF